MQGRRLPDGWHYFDCEPGDYWKQSYKTTDEPLAAFADEAKRNVEWDWCIKDPHGNMGTIRAHDVTEHEDGTITVSPSILDDSEGGYHGFLQRGVWSDG